MLRRLLNIASIICLVLCVAMMGMWVRSYRDREDMVEWRGRLPGSLGFLFRSEWGKLLSGGFVLGPSDAKGLPNDWPYVVMVSPNHQDRVIQIPPWSHRALLYPWGFNDTWTSSSWVLMLPYWFLVAASGLLAMAFRLRWPPQFTLRGLFIVTTFLAVVLGMIAWLDRAWIGK